MTLPYLAWEFLKNFDLNKTIIDYSFLSKCLTKLEGVTPVNILKTVENFECEENPHSLAKKLNLYNRYFSSL